MTNYINSETIKQNAECLAKEKCGCFYQTIASRDGYNIAIVMGWINGFDSEDNDKYSDGTWRICIKIGYQLSNCITQCDYDLDWLMPYYSEGEICDSERSIWEDSDFDFLAEQMNDEADYVLSHWNEFERS